MTVASSLAKAGPFLDTGGTSYPFALQTPDAASVKVVRTTKVGDLYSDATLERGVDYNVSLNPDQESSPGGTVETTVSVAGTYITILRDIDATQGTSIPNQGGFYPEVLERALDKLTMLIQQARAEMGRALLLSYADTSTNLEDLVRGVVSAGDAAAQSASQAAGSASAASGSAGSASVAAQLAQDWASKTDAPVAGGEYSAKKHAQDAAASAGQAAAGVLDKPLTGLSLVDTSAVTATDTVLQAVGKLQAGKSAIWHTHVIADVTGLATALDGLLDVPTSTVTSAAYTLQLADRGKCVDVGHAITVPTLATVAFPKGSVVNLQNVTASGLTITAQSGATVYLAGDSTKTGPFTLKGYGWVVLRKIDSASTWVISGAGL